MAEQGAGKTAWKWKPKGVPVAGEQVLLYEPGGWGDILKGIWAAETAGVLARASASARPGQALVCLDPFAGAPEYPLSAKARARLEIVHRPGFAALQQGFIIRDRLASTGLVVRTCWETVGVVADLRVFDRNPTSQSAWQTVAGAHWLSVAGGEEVFDEHWPGDGRADLVLLDPYDLLADWKSWVPAVARAANRSLVLMYLFNRSPRGARHWSDYRNFRESLRSALGPGVASLVGRLPSDDVLPRAYHEVILAGHRDIVAGLSLRLAELTRDLAGTIAREGAFEDGLATVHHSVKLGGDRAKPSREKKGD